ncbi:helix-turn-helix domain-containing protein [Comamonadaceae bacterium OTU4NAUVB1]|jgi:AraC-like DNA-binding protein|nr:helix-turn-helix domain-containing protein [Comamonadaceae bacterium OTU4NAUVB1]HSU21840.1 helix-turn-helix domain-containing protein [Variovorax sp.]
MELNYSTRAAGTAHRFAYWSDVVCSHFIPAASTVPCRDDFDARLEVRPLGSLTLARMSSPAHAWERTPYHLRTGPNDDFMLSLVVEGHGRLSQGGRQMVQRPGDIALYDAARPFTYDLQPDAFLMLRIPRRRLLALVPEAERLTAVPLSEGSPVATLLAGVMREAAVMEFSGHEGAQGPLANSLLDMLAVVLQMRQDGASVPRSAHEALFQRACAHIDAHLDDCELDVARIAASQHVSARTLTRVFACHGTTPMQWLWKRRLEASHRALTEGRVQQVTQAAFQCGFSDLSHFCRVFKKAYGTTPHTLLRTH